MRDERRVRHELVSPLIPERKQLLDLRVLIEDPEEHLGPDRGHVRLQVAPRGLDETLLVLRQREARQRPGARDAGAGAEARLR